MVRELVHNLRTVSPTSVLFFFFSHNFVPLSPKIVVSEHYPWFLRGIILRIDTSETSKQRIRQLLVASPSATQIYESVFGLPTLVSAKHVSLCKIVVVAVSLGLIWSRHVVAMWPEQKKNRSPPNCCQTCRCAHAG